MSEDLKELSDKDLYQKLIDGEQEEMGAIIAEKKRREKLDNNKHETKKIKIASRANNIAIISAIFSAIATFISAIALYFSLN